MKLVNKSINRDGSVSLHLPNRTDEQGHVTLRPEDDEDMWHVYNLIAEVSPISRRPCRGSQALHREIRREAEQT